MDGLWKYVRWGLIVIVAIGSLSFVLGWLSLPGEVLDPDAGLSRWRWFYDTHEALNATAANITSAESAVLDFQNLNGDISTWNWQQNNEYQRLTSVYRGYITHYNRLANQYNAKMRDVTRNWASPPDLPTHIPNWTGR